MHAYRFTERGGQFPVDVSLAQARAEKFDAILLPGGVLNPDQLRMDESAILFASEP
ncbi:MAG: DJ-1/PfpI family protein [Rhodopila sp.]